MAVAQFESPETVVEPSFWTTLARNKLNLYRLNTDDVVINASALVGRTLVGRTAKDTVAVFPSRLMFSAESFPIQDEEEIDQDKKIVTSSVDNEKIQKFINQVNYPMTLKIVNSIEEFKEINKIELLKTHSLGIWNMICDEKNEDGLSNSNLLNQSLLLTFPNLKKHVIDYWFAFPTFIPPSGPFLLDNWTKLSDSSKIDSHLFNNLIDYFNFDSNRVSGIIFNNKIYNLIDFYRLFKTDSSINILKDIIFIHSDMCTNLEKSSSFIRNFLLFIVHKFYIPYFKRESNVINDQHISISFINWRDYKHSDFKNTISYICNYEYKITEKDSNIQPPVNGWERDFSGVLKPKEIDIKSYMDPIKLAETSVDLNLKLMRWRIAPELELEKIKKTKCLLLGAGTLGSYVARTLIGWGIRNITFVDYGNVSYSNPARQPLFNFNDAISNLPKAETAAKNLKDIIPGINAIGLNLSIPMPGHNEHLDLKINDRITMLEKLIDEHDVIYLLMDSRESRWLPTLIASAKNKIVINAALGFDTFLVMRHGVRDLLNQEKQPELGCYYCNDVVAPGDSISNRTLDQQCTVSRPGLSAIASATSVELMITILSHPKLGLAEAPISDDKIDITSSNSDNSIFEIIPHQIRGYLSYFKNLIIKGTSYSKCTACSNLVIEEYLNNGHEFILKVLQDSKYLEKITGLEELYKEGDEVDVDWIDEVSDEADEF